MYRSIQDQLIDAARPRMRNTANGLMWCPSCDRSWSPGAPEIGAHTPGCPWWLTQLYHQAIDREVELKNKISDRVTEIGCRLWAENPLSKVLVDGDVDVREYHWGVQLEYRRNTPIETVQVSLRLPPDAFDGDPLLQDLKTRYRELEIANEHISNAYYNHGNEEEEKVAGA